MEKMKVAFIGGLTDGKEVFDYLDANKYVELGLVITYPDGSEKPRHVDFPNERRVIKSGAANGHIQEIVGYAPDLIFVAGWSELLKKEILDCPPLGVIGFHPSRLPMDRGRSVLAWQIEEGYTESALSMFYYIDIPDAGDIIAQEKFLIEDNDYINDILNKVDHATHSLMRAYFPLIRSGRAPRRTQNSNEGNFRRLRDDRDSQIDWDSNAEVVYNKIRAISKPYPGAEAWIENKKYKIFEAEVITNFLWGNSLAPGALVASIYDKSLIVRCRNGFIRVLGHEEIQMP